MTINIPGFSKVSVGGQSKVVMRPSQTPLTAVGGATTDVTINNIVYRTHTFTSSGILTVTSATDNIATVEYLVVAGGGGGGDDAFPNGGNVPYGGGGGAGGVLTSTLILNVGSYNITVGAGGAGAVGNTASSGSPTEMELSPLSTIIAVGGGRAGDGYPIPGSPGGSGGGVTGRNGFSVPTAGGFGTAGQGNPALPTNSIGGSSTGGGGAGSSPPPSQVWKGGAGVESFSNTFQPTFYGGGGSGGNQSIGPTPGGSDIGGTGASPSDLAGGNAAISTGSGGGGGRAPSSGGNGASGIVIIRYRIS